jgi:hypothetical protein
MSINEKPPIEDREKFTFTKEQKIDFIALLQAEGIPVIIWADSEQKTKFIEFSIPHFQRWVYDEITAIKKELGMGEIAKG